MLPQKPCDFHAVLFVVGRLNPTWLFAYFLSFRESIPVNKNKLYPFNNFIVMKQWENNLENNRHKYMYNCRSQILEILNKTSSFFTCIQFHIALPEKLLFTTLLLICLPFIYIFIFELQSDQLPDFNPEVLLFLPVSAGDTCSIPGKIAWRRKW